jgi:hypothetical protein
MLVGRIVEVGSGPGMVLDSKVTGAKLPNSLRGDRFSAVTLPAYGRQRVVRVKGVILPIDRMFSRDPMLTLIDANRENGTSIVL